ncbi:unnamed protein product [Chondrus crispus]|uniref:Uncharacterized protein n=1 Tax=Chondrus crispus TaxID=2769 RepID=R7QMQ9_CHOCR|nr:unnamed protein product [Chondrus crispus]CDF39802.1 unnamed protein product [Chondrus crispus]|eukprot:XP_005710096.1 unnamed protein product [Chondrus crispus]
MPHVFNTHIPLSNIDVSSTLDLCFHHCTVYVCPTRPHPFPVTHFCKRHALCLLLLYIFVAECINGCILVKAQIISYLRVCLCYVVMTNSRTVCI